MECLPWVTARLEKDYQAKQRIYVLNANVTVKWNANEEIFHNA